LVTGDTKLSSNGVPPDLLVSSHDRIRSEQVKSVTQVDETHTVSSITPAGRGLKAADLRSYSTYHGFFAIFAKIWLFFIALKRFFFFFFCQFITKRYKLKSQLRIGGKKHASKQ